MTAPHPRSWARLHPAPWFNCTPRPWCVSVRLPEPMPGLERAEREFWWGAFDDRLSRWRALYFAARLTNMSDKQAAEQAWQQWRGGE